MANNNTTAGALMLVAGGILGAGLALLYAPQSGARTRKDIARYSKKMKRKTEAMVDDFTENVSEMVEKITERAEDILDRGKDMAYGAKKELLKAFEAGQDQLEKQRVRLVKLVG